MVKLIAEAAVVVVSIWFIIICLINAVTLFLIISLSFIIVIGSLIVVVAADVINSYKVGIAVVVVVVVAIDNWSIISLLLSKLLYNGDSDDWSPINLNKIKTQ